MKRGLRSGRAQGQPRVPGCWQEMKERMHDARDDAALVDATVELDNDLARAVVVDLLELLDVACARATRQRVGSLVRTKAGLDGPCFCITVR